MLPEFAALSRPLPRSGDACTVQIDAAQKPSVSCLDRSRNCDGESVVVRAAALDEVTERLAEAHRAAT